MPHPTLPLVALLVLAACSGDDGSDREPRNPITSTPATDSVATTDSATPTPTTSTSPTAETGLIITGVPTGTTGDTGTTAATADTAAVIDCSLTVPIAASSQVVTGARGYHGLVFNDLGEIVGSDGSSLIAADSLGNWRVFLPGTGNLEQLDRLSDGTIIAGSSSDGLVFRIDTNGAVTPLASISSVYGVRVGPDDLVYVANWDAIYRIDPISGTVTTWLDNNSYSPKVLDFSHDLTKMYFGTISTGGDVYSVDLDANYDPIGPPVLLASTPGSWHDGLAVDVCGNIYVAEYNTSGMYLISPSGNVSTLFTAPGGGGPDYYGHGVVFGTGTDGWLADAIYFPQPYNDDTVGEAIVGIPHRSYTGPVINQP